MAKRLSNSVPAPKLAATWDAWPYRIGCPVWGCKEWAGQIYPTGTQSENFLSWYSRLMPTVEGNSTFYSVPGPEVFRKWADSAADGFQFCFKFPRSISHEHQLSHCQALTKEWLARLEILKAAGRLGPTFLQLAPSFSSRSFPQLQEFLEQLPRDWPWSVEVRHRDWFDGDVWETRLNRLLSDLGIDRVIFDSRPLNAMAPSDEAEAASQVRKPKVPLRVETTARQPMVRLIGRNDLQEVTDYWDEWAERIAHWIHQGLEPWVFTHAPDDAFAPMLVHALHQRIQTRLSRLPSLPTLDQVIAKEAESNPSSGKLTQLRLFP
jgi:uncharacterized protein YecE (DUF72 family)